MMKERLSADFIIKVIAITIGMIIGFALVGIIIGLVFGIPWLINIIETLVDKI